ALGTHWGVIHILDFDGNEVKRFRSHAATVNHLSIDNAGEYVASASDDAPCYRETRLGRVVTFTCGRTDLLTRDRRKTPCFVPEGKVVVNALYTPEVIAFDYRRPVKCVAIDPEYSRKSSKQFVSGGMAGQLIMNEKGWFTHKDTTLHSGEGPIISMQWRGNLIAWSNDVVSVVLFWCPPNDAHVWNHETPVLLIPWCAGGVNIYDVVSAARVAHIDRPQGSPRPDLYKCHLRWKSDDTLLIGWANWVEVARVRERPRGSLVAASVPTFQVDVLTMFQTDYIISGVAPFRDMLLLLTYTVDRMIENEQTEDEEEQRRKVACRPELRIVDSKNEELSSDALSLTGFEYYQPNDYVFDYFPSEDLFYVVSPKDLVVAQPRDLDDHIGWLLGHFKYEEALAALEEAMPLHGGVDRPEVPFASRGARCGRVAFFLYYRLLLFNRRLFLKKCPLARGFSQYGRSHGHVTLRNLRKGEYDRAAALCSKVLSDDARRWEDWVFRFTELRQLKAISPYIPVSQPQLSSTVYEMVIAYFLSRDYHVSDFPLLQFGVLCNSQAVERIDLGISPVLMQTLLTMIRRWPASLYDANAVVKAVRDRLAEIEAALPRDTDELDASPDSSSASLQDSEGAPAPADEAAASAREDRDVLMRALAELYVAEGRPGKALEYQLRLGDENAVDLVREHNLFSDIRDKAVVLMEFDRRWERKNLRQKAAAAADGKEALARAKDFGSIGSLLGLRKVSRGPALHMMVTHTDEIPVPLVVDQLFPRPALLHTYLDAVFERDASLGSDFHDLQVELYAEFERSKLLDFLKASNYYSLEKVEKLRGPAKGGGAGWGSLRLIFFFVGTYIVTLFLSFGDVSLCGANQSYAICEQRDLVPEMVFILGRMGNNTRALGLIIERMGDVERAIEFATTQDDPELWEDLLAYSLDKPGEFFFPASWRRIAEPCVQLTGVFGGGGCGAGPHTAFIKGLLENAATHVDPVKLIRRVPEGLEIPGLKGSLQKILFDYNLQVCHIQNFEAETAPGRRRGRSAVFFSFGSERRGPVERTDLRCSARATDSRRCSRVRKRS
ncbi:MAG: LOW QUALITY PROTEIN: hypothetical protein BJ554DRAFT_7565, partial [Olpidium bornovanus]